MNPTAVILFNLNNIGKNEYDKEVLINSVSKEEPRLY